MAWLFTVIAFWVGLGFGMALSAYILLTAAFMAERHNVVSPQDYLTRLL